jgi:uncharacterized protein with LGFP repeats
MKTKFASKLEGRRYSFITLHPCGQNQTPHVLTCRDDDFLFLEGNLQKNRCAYEKAEDQRGSEASSKEAKC